MNLVKHQVNYFHFNLFVNINFYFKIIELDIPPDLFQSSEYQKLLSEFLYRSINTLQILKFYATYFFTKHFTTRLKNIDFQSKEKGIQNGLTANVILEHLNIDNQLQVESIRYFMKTHQNGTSLSSSARYSIDLKEIFLYKFLHYLNIGPEVHFLYNEFDANMFFIISRDLSTSETKFLTLKELNESENFQNDFDNSYENKQELIKADFLSKLFILGDITTNGENIGFIKENSKYKLKIVDFCHKIDNFGQSFIEAYDFYDSFVNSTKSSLNTKGEFSKYFARLDVSMRKLTALDILKEYDIKKAISESQKWTIDYVNNNYKNLYMKDLKLKNFSLDDIRKNNLGEFEEYIETILGKLDIFIKKSSIDSI